MSFFFLKLCYRFSICICICGGMQIRFYGQNPNLSSRYELVLSIYINQLSNLMFSNKNWPTHKLAHRLKCVNACEFSISTTTAYRSVDLWLYIYLNSRSRWDKGQIFHDNYYKNIFMLNSIVCHGLRSNRNWNIKSQIEMNVENNIKIFTYKNHDFVAQIGRSEWCLQCQKYTLDI